LKQLLKYCNVVPAIDQVEFHPHLYQHELLEFCQEKGIQLVAYSSLAVGKLVQNPEVAIVAQKYGVTIPQVLLRWAIQHNIPVIPRSTNQERLAKNSQLFDFVISEMDMKVLDSMNKNYHYCWDPTAIP